MSVQRRKSYVLLHLVRYLNFSSSLQPACPCFCREGTDSDKGGFPLSHNFYVRTHLNFTRVNKIEAMYKRSRVNVKFEPRSTFMITRDRPYIASILFTRVKFTCVRA